MLTGITKPNGEGTGSGEMTIMDKLLQELMAIADVAQITFDGKEVSIEVAKKFEHGKAWARARYPIDSFWGEQSFRDYVVQFLKMSIEGRINEAKQSPDEEPW